MSTRIDLLTGTRRIGLALGLMGLVLAVAAPVTSAANPKTTRVSVRSNGAQGDAFSDEPAISANGRYVAFSSAATNLVNTDTNGVTDVFVHDRQTKRTTRVSVRSTGTQGDGQSAEPAISDDGRYVAFLSDATNLVNGDTNGVTDIFVRDRQTNKTTRVSVRSNGAQGDSSSDEPAISDDGRYVAFRSEATNLVNGDTNGQLDVFVHDRQTKRTTRVSVRSNGTQGDSFSFDPTVSATGRYVAFGSAATNLVNGDTNGVTDIFVHDRQTKRTTRVSVRSNGAQADSLSDDPSISANGRYMAFLSDATNLVSGDTNSTYDVFVHDRQTKRTTRVSVRSNGAQGDSSSDVPAISDGGRYVAFRSEATNLVSGDTNGVTDIFVHDRQTKRTTRVSVRSNGAQGDSGTYDPSISADGRYVAFGSEATNLVTGDTNGVTDVFRRGPLH